MKVLVVDDHALIREALHGVLKELRDDVKIIESADYAQARRHIEQEHDIGLVLLDLNLPDRSGLAALAELRQRHPSISVVVLSAFNDRENVARALQLGALGFIPKSAAREVMISALRLVFSGGVYIPPDILGPSGRHGRSPQELGLTGRQLDVLALMMQGKSNKAICRALDLAEPTIKNHVSAILKALNASNRTEAVIAASALRWDPTPAAER